MIEAQILHVPFAAGFHLYLFEKFTINGRDQVSAARPIEFEPLVPDVAIARDPTLRLCYESAQRMMDELWNAGLRPTGGHGAAGHLAATEKHLDDMRAIVAKQLKTDLPK